MIITTGETIPGHRISEICGTVTGNTVRAKHIGRDVMAGLKTIVGGEIKGYTEMLSEARESAQDRMVAQAQALGADAIIAARFTTSNVSQGMSELLAFGTAVKLEPASN